MRYPMLRSGAGPALLPSLPAISERQLRRRCRAVEVDLSRCALQAGYHDQAHLHRECRRLMGATPGELVAQAGESCVGHEHAASCVPLLRAGDSRSVQARRRVPS